MATTDKKTVTKAKKKVVNNITDHGRVYVTSTFNNTLITVTNEKGNTLAWSSAGARGFKGTRKSTPYAASLAAENAVKKIVLKKTKLSPKEIMTRVDKLAKIVGKSVPKDWDTVKVIREMRCHGS